MRLPWVERVLLTPFAEVQQRVADQLTGRAVGPRLRRRELQRRGPAGALRGGDLRVPDRLGGAAARGGGRVHADHRREHRPARAPVTDRGEPGAARPAARLRLARHPDPRRGGLRLRLDGPAGLRRRSGVVRGPRAGRCGAGASWCWRRSWWRPTSPPRPSSTRARRSTSSRAGSR